jgi:nucleoside-diphosphate-sugar epimerase
LRLCEAEGDVALNRAEPDRDRPVCKVARAQSVLGFKAKTSLETGLQAEIDWLRHLQVKPA